MARDLFTNQASTTVAASKTAPAAGTTESWTVASSSAFPAASNTAVPVTQFYVADPNAPTELILVTNVSGTTWSVTRGADGTTPVTHSAGFTLKNVVPATWLQRIDNRFKEEEYNVLDFGAVGDDSTDNYDAFQDALNAARDNGGGVIVIPRGDYRFETTPFKIYEGTHIRAHPQAHIKNYAGTSASMFWNGTGGDAPTGYAGNGNITIEGGIWDQRGDAVGGAACFSFAHGKNLTWRDCIIRDVRGTHAIEINGCQTVRIVNCTFEGFYDPDPGGPASREYSEAVQLDLMKGSDYYGAFGAYDNTTCDDVLVDGCTFTISSNASTHEWGRGVGSHNGTIGKWHTNIRVTNNYFNVKHEAVRGYSWNRTVVANNIMVDGSLGITMESIPWDSVDSEMTKDANGVQQSTSQDFQDFTITGNMIYGSQAGETNQPVIYVTGETTGMCLNGTIANNTITDCGDDAIAVLFGEDIEISGNAIKNPGQYGILLTDSVGIGVTGNKVNGPGHSGIGVFSTTQSQVASNTLRNAARHGIYTSFATDVVINGNFIYGASRTTDNTYAALYNDSGASTCSWTGNVVRKVGSGNEYDYAFEVGSGGTHYIKGNDFEKGDTGRFNLSGTIQGMTSITFCQDGTMGGISVEAMEWIAPTSGYIKRFNTRMISGSATNFRPLVVNPSTGVTRITGSGASTSTTVGGANQTIEYEAGERIQIEQYNTGTSPVGLMCTLWVIENGSDL